MIIIGERSLANTSLPLTGQEKNLLIHATDRPMRAPDFARTGPKNPNLRVFVVNFDGTQNNRDDVPEGEQTTLVAKNDAKMRALGNPAIDSRYYRGVGTTHLPITRMFQSATGAGCAGNAEQAHQDFAEQAQAWLKENPNVKIHVHAVGFSRGAATALHFLNLVHDRGAVAKDAPPESVPERLRARKINSSTTLLDTVSTGQAQQLKLTLPDTCVAALHEYSINEQRSLFPLREISVGADREIAIAIGATMPSAKPQPKGPLKYSRIQEIALPGVHSDIGGSYADGGISKVSEYLMDSFQQSLGFDLQPARPSVEQIQSFHQHDSRFDYERILGGALPNPEHVRVVQKAEVDRWQGHWMQQITVEGIERHPDTRNNVRQSTVNVDHFDKAAFLGPEIPFFGKNVEIMLSPASTPANIGANYFPTEHGLIVATLCDDELISEAAGNAAFQLREDGLYVFGQKVPNIPRPDLLIKHWEEQTRKGEKPSAVSIKINAWRVGSFAEADQTPHAPNPAYVAPTDPWPHAMRASVVLLNNPANKLTARQAQQMIHFAAKAAASELLRAQSDLASATIVAIAKESLADGDFPRAGFAMSAIDSNGNSVSTHQEPSTPEGRILRSRMIELANGIEAVAEGVANRGYLPRPGEPHSFTRTVTPRNTPNGPEQLVSLQPNSAASIPAVMPFSSELRSLPPITSQNISAKLVKMRAWQSPQPHSIQTAHAKATP